MSRAVTFLELMIVVLIIGIVAAFAVPAYINAQERAKNNQAVAMLQLIREAERMNDLETGSGYVSCANTAACNTALGLDLPTTRAAWRYRVITGGGPSPTFRAIAQRTSGPVPRRRWIIDETVNPPVCIGTNYCF